MSNPTSFAISEMFKDKDYFCKEMIWDAGVVTLTIDHVEFHEKVPLPGTNRTNARYVVLWKPARSGTPPPLTLNATNKGFLIRELGGKATSAWHGKKVGLYVDKSVKMKGEVVGGVRMVLNGKHSGNQAPPAKTQQRKAAPPSQPDTPPPSNDADDPTEHYE